MEVEWWRGGECGVCSSIALDFRPGRLFPTSKPPCMCVCVPPSPSLYTISPAVPTSPSSFPRRVRIASPGILWAAAGWGGGQREE